jgi:predicted RNA binding protein YcfA (HicA-like mRNA interferase family)
VKKEKFLKHLRENACEFTGRQKGSHAMVVNTINGKKSVVPLHPNILESTAFAICKQLEIPKPSIN